MEYAKGVDSTPPSLFIFALSIRALVVAAVLPPESGHHLLKHGSVIMDADLLIVGGQHLVLLAPDLVPAITFKCFYFHCFHVFRRRLWPYM